MLRAMKVYYSLGFGLGYTSGRYRRQGVKTLLGLV